MLVASRVRVVVRCVNGFCPRAGKEIGALELDAGTTVVDERYCAKCRQVIRQRVSA